MSLTPREFKRARCAFARFARAENEHVAFAQIAKDFYRQIDCDRSDGDGAAGDIGAAADLLGHAKCPLKRRCKNGPALPDRARAS